MAESGSAGGSEILQLGDVLVGVGADADTTATYLHFTFDPETNATIIEMTSQPETGAAPLQKVVLAGVDLTAIGDDGAIIAALLSQSQFVPDA
jgi:hypothetical protein